MMFDNGVKKSCTIRILYHKSKSTFSVIKVINLNIASKFSRIVMVRRRKVRSISIGESGYLHYCHDYVDAIDILLKNIELIHSFDCKFTQISLID